MANENGWSITCDEFEQKLGCLVDGELSRFETLAMERHCAKCCSCKQARAEFEFSLRLVKNLPDISPSKKSLENIYAGIERELGIKLKIGG